MAKKETELDNIYTFFNTRLNSCFNELYDKSMWSFGWLIAISIIVAILGIGGLMTSARVSKLQDKVGILECRHWGEDSGQPWAYYDGECHLM